MNYQELLNLIDKLDQSSVAYVEFTQSGDKVVLAKEVPQSTRQETAVSHQSTNQPLLVNHQSTEQPFTNPIDTTSSSITEGEPVLSPLVGVAYLQPKPDADPFVKVGDTVQKGQVLCIVEAMKLMNDIVSPFDGVVTEVLIDNETVVEFNQPLFKINTK